MCPGEPIRLEGSPEDPRAVGTRDRSLDVTDRLASYGRRMGRELASISGYVLKSKSPSCGMERVKVYGRGGSPAKSGRGIYARELMKTQPLLPVEEEGRLNDPHLRENFIERVYAYRRWQDLVASGVTPDRLVAFHTAHKLLLMAHGRERLRELGRLIADTGRRAIDELAEEYGEKFMAALTYRATRKRHTDVLQHLLGYLKKSLDRDDKAEMLGIIEDYRQGRVPLIVPITMFRHHFRVHPHPYIDRQLYLTWAPAGLSLWNAV